MKKCTQFFLSLLACGLIGTTFALAAHHGHGMSKESSGHTETVDKMESLIAVMTPTERSSVSGTVTFKKVGEDKVKVVAQLSGLNPNSLHAIHIHEYGDLRAEDGTAAGSHYNPEGHPHALPTEGKRHAGDFGNLEADDEGKAYFSITVDNLTLNGKKNPIIGRSVIVHAGEDDGSQPVGNAGHRISQGVIGVMNAGYAEE